MPSPTSKKFLQLAYKVFNTEPSPRKFHDGCYPINGSFPIPIGPPKRDPRLAAARWKAVDTIRFEDGSVYEVALRRVR